MVILQVTKKKQGFTLSQENTVLEKPQGWERDRLSPPAFRNQKANCLNNHNPCLHCLQHSPKKWDFVFIITIITYSDSIFKENVSN